MNDDRTKFQANGLKWLYEMELLDDPQLINNLKQNIFIASNFKVRDVEFVMSQEDKKMLIWIDLNWYNRRFKAKPISYDIYDVLSQLLPSFAFRIVTDRSILDLAITKLKQSLQRRDYVSSTNGVDADSPDDSASKKEELSKASDLLPDKEEQTDD